MLLNETNLEIPPIDRFGIGLPDFWGRKNIILEENSKLNFVFIKQSNIIRFNKLIENIYLYGSKHLLKNAKVGEILRTSDDSGYFIEFFILHNTDNNNRCLHRLSQRMSIVYAEGMDKLDYISATKIKHPNKFSASALPTWTKADAYWPTFNDEPMKFLFETDLCESDTNKDYLTWDENIFVFFYDLGDDLVFKITTQKMKYQTLQSHYNQETRRENKTT